MSVRVHPLLRLLGNVAVGTTQVVGAVVIVPLIDGVWRWLFVAVALLGLLGSYRGAQLAFRAMRASGSANSAAT